MDQEVRLAVLSVDGKSAFRSYERSCCCPGSPRCTWCKFFQPLEFLHEEPNYSEGRRHNSYPVQRHLKISALIFGWRRRVDSLIYPGGNTAGLPTRSLLRRLSKGIAPPSITEAHMLVTLSTMIPSKAWYQQIPRAMFGRYVLK